MRKQGLQLTRNQEENLEICFKGPDNVMHWSKIRASLLKIVESFQNRSEDPVQEVIDMFDIDGLRYLRYVRGKLVMVLECPCGQCGQYFRYPVSRKGNTLELPLHSLCSVSSHGRPGKTASIGGPNRQYHG